jgi:hypothetical protein
MSASIRGSFDVRLVPLEPAFSGDMPGLGRMSIDKKYRGDLEGSSRGEMLSAMTSVKGSAGYVAIERVTGTLQGRKGTFVLQHFAAMNRGVPQLTISVVPDSGTDELSGLEGKMNIEIVEGCHFYVFEFSINHPG